MSPDRPRFFTWFFLDPGRDLEHTEFISALRDEWAFLSSRPGWGSPSQSPERRAGSVAKHQPRDRARAPRLRSSPDPLDPAQPDPIATRQPEASAWSPRSWFGGRSTSHEIARRYLGHGRRTSKGSTGQEENVACKPTKLTCGSWARCWSGRLESNQRHSAWEADVLPLNYARISMTSREHQLGELKNQGPSCAHDPSHADHITPYQHLHGVKSG
jgi:hypothetical protein